MKDIKGIIFDYGATIDSNGVHWAEIIWQGYTKAGVNITRQQFRDAYVYAERALAKKKYIYPHHNFLDLMRIKIAVEFESLDIKEDNATYIESIAMYCYNYAKRSAENAKPVLSYLSEKYPFVLVSNFYGNIESVLKDFGLDKYFPIIVESAVVGIRKPDPAIFALGVKALNLPSSQVVVIGDSYSKDIAPAASLGCDTIWIKGKGWDEKEDEIKHDKIITEFSQLLNLL